MPDPATIERLANRVENLLAQEIFHRRNHPSRPKFPHSRVTQYTDEFREDVAEWARELEHIINEQVRCIPTLLSAARDLAAVTAERDRMRDVLREISSAIPSKASQGWTGKSQMLSIGRIGWSIYRSDDHRGRPVATFEDESESRDFLFGRVISASVAVEIDELVHREARSALAQQENQR